MSNFEKNRQKGTRGKDKVFIISYFDKRITDTLMKVDEIKEKILPILIKHKIKKAGIFGSVAKDMAKKESDVDLLVELGEEISLLDFIGIKLELEELLKKKVDLVEYKAVKPLLKKTILGEEVRIYGE